MNKYDGRQFRPRCDDCGLFVGYDADSYTPYGCADPEAPEPYDPSYLCAKCSEKDYKEWLAGFKNGRRSGDWQKSQAEMRAAKECGLAYVGSSGVGMLGTKDWASAYQYITQEEYDRLSTMPYWGYCKVCGAERKGGHCGDEKCVESFEAKVAAIKK